MKFAHLNEAGELTGHVHEAGDYYVTGPHGTSVGGHLLTLADREALGFRPVTSLDPPPFSDLEHRLVTTLALDAEGLPTEQHELVLLSEGEVQARRLGLSETAHAGINARREVSIDAGFLHDGHFWDSDERSRNNLTAAISGFAAGIPIPENFTWRSASNADVLMDLPALLALGAAMLTHVNASYQVSWALKAAVEAAEDPRTVDIEGAPWPG